MDIQENREPLEPVNLKNLDHWIKISGFFACLFVTLAFFSAVNLADPDLWGYLSFGRLFWHSEKFPYTDVFSYVPTLNLWVYHEWLTGVLFYPLYQVLRTPGLQVLKYGLGLGILTWVLWSNWSLTEPTTGDLAARSRRRFTVAGPP